VTSCWSGVTAWSAWTTSTRDRWKTIKHLKNGADFRFEMLDITAYYEIDEPIDFVYHMAWPASPIDYARLRLHTLKVGAYGTHNTLGLAKKHRARFLLTSTSEV
jgi:dTDP-glucose 4,6-dehydratase